VRQVNSEAKAFVRPAKRIENEYEFRARIWIYNGPTPWHFVTLPKKLAAEIRLFHGDLEIGWGSIRVNAKIASTAWKTSIFRDSKSGSYLLPLKAEIRKKEKLQAEQMISVTIAIDTDKVKGTRKGRGKA
jgi:hypothetical protein